MEGDVTAIYLELKFQAVLYFHVIIPYSPKFLDGYLEEMLGRENTGEAWLVGNIAAYTGEFLFFLSFLIVLR